MIKETKKILNNLEMKIEIVSNSVEKPIIQALQSHELAKVALQQVKELLSTSSFDTELNEIEYFKHIQPRIASHAIYYCLIHLYYSKSSGFCNEKQIKNYCKKSIHQVDSYFSENQAFITYYKSGSCELDVYHFMRNKSVSALLLDECLAFVEPSCSTGYDLIAARYMAYSNLRIFLKNEIRTIKIKQKSPYISIISEEQNKAVWTDKKIGLIELVYAIHGAACINNGKCELDDIAKAVENAFHVKLGNIYTSFQEICERKNPTQLIDLLKNTLESKINSKYK